MGAGEPLRTGSLFTGIGAFDLGLERTGGFRVIWQCESDPFCNRVLARHWPDVPRYPDIRTLRAEDVEAVDVLCGGSPCQDLSHAGRREGIDGERSGLWAHYARLIRDLRPRYALLENVPGLLAGGLGRVLGDLAACGYDAEWESLPAGAFGAPHLRDRVWLVAYPHTDRIGRGLLGLEEPPDELGPCGDEPDRLRAPGPLADPDHAGLRQRWRAESVQPQLDSAERRGEDVADPELRRWQGRTGPITEMDRRAQPEDRGEELADPQGLGLQPRSWSGLALRTGTAALEPEGRPAPSRRGGGQPSPELLRMADGAPPELDGSFWRTEPCPRTGVGIPDRVARLRALGNALVPAIASWIGGRILAYESLQCAQADRGGGVGGLPARLADRPAPEGDRPDVRHRPLDGELDQDRHQLRLRAPEQVVDATP